MCSILYDLKISKSLLKQDGWDIREYQRLSAENGNQQYEFDRGGFGNTELRRATDAGSKDKKGKKKNNDDSHNTPPTEKRVWSINEHY